MSPIGVDHPLIVPEVLRTWSDRLDGGGPALSGRCDSGAAGRSQVVFGDGSDPSTGITFVTLVTFLAMQGHSIAGAGGVIGVGGDCPGPQVLAGLHLRDVELPAIYRWIGALIGRGIHNHHSLYTLPLPAYSIAGRSGAIGVGGDCPGPQIVIIQDLRHHGLPPLGRSPGGRVGGGIGNGDKENPLAIISILGLPPDDYVSSCSRHYMLSISVTTM